MNQRLARAFSWHMALGLVSACGGTLGASEAAQPSGLGPLIRTIATPTPLVPMDRSRGSLGHPVIEGNFTVDIAPPGVGIDPVPIEPVALPTVAALASGVFINFESPMVKPLTVNSAGTRLYATNTPGNALVVMDIAGPSTPMRVLNTIPVGLDPVSVAIQPGTNDRTVWVVNHISDDVSVIDMQTGTVTRIIHVGDEPVNILFSPDGAFAWVVLQGPHALSAPPFNHTSSLVTINTATGAIVNALTLDIHSARAAAYDAAEQKLIIGALHSGNNTTQTFDPMFVQTGIDQNQQPTGGFAPTTLIVQFFPPTAGLFAAAPLLSPYPDVMNSGSGAGVGPAPFVARIVPDGGKISVWADIIDVLTGDNGLADPLMVQAMVDFGILNAPVVIDRLINDVKNTVDNDLLIVDVASPGTPVVESIIGDVGTTITALAVQPGTRRIFAANLDAHNTTRLTPNLRGTFVDHQLVVIDDYLALTPAITTIDLNGDIANFHNVSTPNADALARSLADPKDVVFSPDGRRVFVAALGSDRIGIYETDDDALRFERVDVGRGPRGMVFEPSRQRLFVLNRTDMTVQQLDASSLIPTLTATRALFNPEPNDIRHGRDFLFSAKFSNNAGQSCAMCHIDGGLDHLAWDLGNPHGPMGPVPSNMCSEDSVPGLDPCARSHPLKGPMVTQSLRGLSGRNPFHWRGDKPLFTDFNEAFDGLLGGSELSAADMDRFDRFVKTMVYAPNPFWERNNTPKDPDAPAGFVHFLTPNGPGVVNAGTCQNCHQLEHDGAGRLAGFTDDRGVDESAFFMQIQEITQLRGLYKKFPSDRFGGFGLIHDGREEREQNGHPLLTFLKTFFRNMDAQGRQETTAMVTAFPNNVTNIVGWQVRVRGVATAQQLADINLMIDQHHPASLNLGAPWPAQPDPQPSRCDVVAQGFVSGQPRGYLYDHAASHLAGTPTFRSDRDELVPQSALTTQLGSGMLIFMAVPPGSGNRVGIDADQDCQLNGLDPFPFSSGDINGSDTFSVQDIFDFLTAYFADAPSADFNISGEISVQDIFDFLGEYFKGGC